MNWKSGRKFIKIKCEFCNNKFTKTETEYKRSENLNRKHYCSIDCYRRDNKRKLLFCENCGIELTSKQMKFCSKKCSNGFNRIGRKHNKKTKEKIKKNSKNQHIISKNKEIYYKNSKICKQCDKIISYDKRKNIFCDIKCKRKYDKRNMSQYQKYYRQCQFDFALNNFPEEFDFTLIEKYGWYQAKNHGDNLNGISRDHMISVKYGYEHKISSEVIKHPANCDLMIQNENVRKHKNCSLSLNELNYKINIWNLKYST